MITTSDNYKQKIGGTIRQVSAKCNWGFVDVNAANNATVSATSEASISKINQTTNSIQVASKKIATLEDDFFKLDGTFELYQEDNDWEIGWYSNSLSNESGEYVTAEALTLNLSENASSVGLTICFDVLTGDCARDFTINYYRGTILIETITVVGNVDAYFISDIGVENFNKIIISITKSNKSYRRVKISEVLFGVMVEYTEQDIVSLTLNEQASIFSDNLATSEIVLVVENFKKKLDIVNPQGIMKYLQSQQVIKSSLGIDGEYISLGDMYLSDWSTTNSDGTSEFVLRTITNFIAGKYIATTLALTNAKALVDTILTNCGITNYEVDNSLANIILNSYVSTMDNKTALQYILNASGAFLKVERDGKIVIKQYMIKASTADITYDNAIKRPKISQQELPNLLSTKYYTYTGTIEQSEATETQVIKDNRISTSITVEKEINNPFLATKSVANQMLENYDNWNKNRLLYEIEWRQDMSIEASDFVMAENDFEARKSIVTQQIIKYNGALSGTTKAVMIVE